MEFTLAQARDAVCTNAWEAVLLQEKWQYYRINAAGS